MHAVLDTKPGSIYNDHISSLYHFPSRYKKVLDNCVGDWVVFREPRDEGGRMAYIAYGKVKNITRDTEKASHYYAHITSFEDFDKTVPWRLNGRYWEKPLRDIETPKVGIYMRGRSVRGLTDSDFAELMRHGSPTFFSKNLTQAPKINEEFHEADDEPFNQELELSEREIVTILGNKKLRDNRFRQRVMKAYSNQCAFTGLSVEGIDGKLGLQAAHILSVEKNGPDIISNGLALTHTVHWMFDNFLLSLDENYKLLISKRGAIPIQYLKMLEGARGGIFLPKDQNFWPRKQFISWHKAKFESWNNPK